MMAPAQSSGFSSLRMAVASKKKQQNPHFRTRRDHASETAEDYVEAIADIIDEFGSCRGVNLAKRFAVSHVTVNRIVRRLEKEGLIATEPYRPITLTSKGRRLAIASRQRHEIVHEFLRSIGVDEATAAVDAEGIEHHVSPKTLKCLQKFTRDIQTSQGKG